MSAVLLSCSSPHSMRVRAHTAMTNAIIKITFFASLRRLSVCTFMKKAIFTTLFCVSIPFVHVVLPASVSELGRQDFLFRVRVVRAQWSSVVPAACTTQFARPLVLPEPCVVTVRAFPCCPRPSAQTSLLPAPDFSQEGFTAAAYPTSTAW